MPVNPSPEIIIAGGSLAGATAAIGLAQQGYSPLVIEKAAFPRQKLCGEFLGPDSFAGLQALGVWDEVLHNAYTPIREAVFYTRQGRSATINLKWLNPTMPFGLAIRRDILDTLLLDKARTAGAQILENTRLKNGLSYCDAAGWHCEIRSQDQDAPTRLNSRVLIDATGRNGGLYEKKAPQKTHRDTSRIGISVHVKAPNLPEEPALRMFFFPGGYGGILPISADTANVCFLAERSAGLALTQSIEETLNQTMRRNPVASAMLANCQPIEPYLTTANLNVTPVNPADPLLRIGDAMVTIDPFTGTGMALAIQGGLLAADTIGEGLAAHWRYPEIRQSYHQRYHRMLGLRFKLLQWFRPFVFSNRIPDWTLPALHPFMPLLTRALR